MGLAAAAALEPATVDVVARAEVHELLVSTVMQLDEPARSTLLLRFFDGLETREIARREGVPAATVRKRLERALAALRVRLTATSGGDESAWRLALAPLTMGPGVAQVGLGGPVTSAALSMGKGGLTMTTTMKAGALVLAVAGAATTVVLTSTGHAKERHRGLRADGSTVALWHFDETSGPLLDHSGHGYDGTPRNGVQQGVRFHGRSVYGFDGVDDYIELPTALLAAGLPQGTIEAWLVLDSTPAPERNFGCFDRGVPASTTSLQFGVLPSGQLTSAIHNTVIPETSAPRPLVVGRLAKVMLTWGDGHVRWYVDGLPAGDVVSSLAPTADGATSVEIGGSIQHLADYALSGLIDEMRISDVIRPAPKEGDDRDDDTDEDEK